MDTHGKAQASRSEINPGSGKSGRTPEKGKAKRTNQQQTLIADDSLRKREELYKTEFRHLERRHIQNRIRHGIQQEQLQGRVRIGENRAFAVRAKRVRVRDNPPVGQSVTVPEYHPVDEHRQKQREVKPRRCLTVSATPRWDRWLIHGNKTRRLETKIANLRRKPPSAAKTILSLLSRCINRPAGCPGQPAKMLSHLCQVREVQFFIRLGKNPRKLVFSPGPERQIGDNPAFSPVPDSAGKRQNRLALSQTQGLRHHSAADDVGVGKRFQICRKHPFRRRWKKQGIGKQTAGRHTSRRPFNAVPHQGRLPARHIGRRLRPGRQSQAQK